MLRRWSTVLLVSLPVCLLAAFVTVPGRFATGTLKERWAYRTAYCTGLDLSHCLSKSSVSWHGQYNIHRVPSRRLVLTFRVASL